MKRSSSKGWTYHFKPGERVGLVGDNGAGKSTLIRLMTGEDKPDGGKVVIGDTVVFGHFSQEPPSFDEGMKVIEALYEIARVHAAQKGPKAIGGATARAVLVSTPPPPRLHPQAQRWRAQKAAPAAGAHGQPQLSWSLTSQPTTSTCLPWASWRSFYWTFPGCLLLVSHDRYFMDKLVDHVFVLDGEGGVRDFPGNYTQYRTKADAEEKAASNEQAAAARAGRKQAADKRPPRQRATTASG